MLSGKRIFLIGILIFLLVAIPVTIYLVSQQLKSNQTPVPATTISLTPNTQTVDVGQDLNFDVSINPDTNPVSYVKLVILYDATKLATTGAGFVPNQSIFPLIVEGPTYDLGTISVTVSINGNSNPVTESTQVGTLSFKTLEKTDTTTPTQVTFGNQTQVLSNGQTTSSENLLATTVPANINIGNTELNLTPTTIQAVISPTTAIANQQQAQGTTTPTPTLISNQTAVTPTVTPTTEPLSYADPSYAATIPICTGFTADRPTSGIAPFNVNFTLVGTSSADIDKATFIFGDGQTQDITAASGAITGNTVNALVMHVYNDSGSFSASGTITDVNGNVSQVTSACSSITVSINSASGSAVTTVPSLAPSGPSTNIITIGVIGIIILAIGTLLLLAL